MAAGPVPTGVLVHQGPGCLSPSLQAFLLCSNGAGPGEDGGEDPRFYVISARAVPEAVQRVRSTRRGRLGACAATPALAARSPAMPCSHCCLACHHREPWSARHCG